MDNISKKKEMVAGFTLIEVIIYVAIVGIVVSGMIQYVLMVNTWQQRTNLSLSANENILNIEMFLRQELGRANEILSPGSGASAISLSYILDGETKNLYLANGKMFSSDFSEPISDANIKISNLNFSNLGLNDIDSLAYSFSLESMAGSSQEYNFLLEYKSAITLD
jgi:prepilin-type N-terminal cleavage/methylation domain-containing protein